MSYADTPLYTIKCPQLTRCSPIRDFNYSHNTYQFFHFFKCFLTFIYIVTYSPLNVWFTFFSLIFALLMYKLRPSQTYFIKSTMASLEETARCPHIWEGNFVLQYIFWCPPSMHDKFVHIWRGKWTKFCQCIRFCPRLGGCPRKAVSTYEKFYCII